MKKIILTAFLTATTLVSAQDTIQKTKHLFFGPKIWLLGSDVHRGDAFGDKDTQFGTEPALHFTAGMFLEYRFNKFAVNLEASYIEQGYKSDFAESRFHPPFKVPNEIRMRGANVYLIPKYYPIKKLSIGAGFYYGRIFKVTQEIGGTLYNYSGDEEKHMDITDDYSKYDAGFVFLSSFDIWKGFFVEGRYTLGIKDVAYNEDSDWWKVAESSGRNTKGDYSIKNRNVSISFGYKF